MSGGKSFQQNNHDSSSEVPRDICPPLAPVFPTSKEVFRSESPEYLSRMAALVGYAKTISCRIRYSKASSSDRQSEHLTDREFGFLSSVSCPDVAVSVTPFSPPM